MTAFFALIKRDIRIALRQLSDTLIVIVFFVISASLFPFGVGAEPNLLARMAPGVLWVTALLSAMLSFDRLFQNDFEDGTLELLVIAPQPLWLSALAKIAAHWITTGFPVLLVAPLIGIMLNLKPEGLAVLIAAMALGTFIISLIGALGAALTLGSR
ncbi:MAG: heme exporter protein CcmB, partial [Pseudomonadota bacterium]|nr:heme exporter protein CcmB [Pseudomonadota bacterium]